MSNLILICGDQLTKSISSLAGCNPNKDTVLLCENWNEAGYIKHHKKKIALIFAAMRHFAEELKTAGYKVQYIKLGKQEASLSFTAAINSLIAKKNFQQIIITQPSEYRVLKEIKRWQRDLGIPVVIREDTRFLCSQAEFAAWAKTRKQMRMEFFYREMRQKHNILLTKDNKPVGGKWNYDTDNRKFPKEQITIPKPHKTKPDNITQTVLELVAKNFPDHFGELEPFEFAVTRKGALQVLRKFIKERLPQFGDYQDAMLQGEPWLYHSHISFYLNCGLLLPLECIKAAEQAYQDRQAPLNAVEGFIRQILGWREYIRGIYWLNMPQYAKLNYLEAKQKLPACYWNGATKMNCIHQCVTETKTNAYAHHIQRLMVLGNFALLIGVKPKALNEWFLAVYADAYEWVELPNVSGMVLFADGGYLASKPYAAGGSYINKMSNYCKSCHYKVSKKLGEEACPFNYLYWNFLASNRNKLAKNPRMSMMYRTYDRMDAANKKQITTDSNIFIKNIS